MVSPTLATRVRTANESDDDLANPGDPSSTSGLLIERLQAWKHMCGYLENYISAIAKSQLGMAKDHEKTVYKTLANPLREAHHFDTALGGVSGLFENLRANTQAQINLYNETSKNLTGSVLPVLERLHAEIKNKNKEITNGAGKGAKSVEAARISSQKHIDLLGQQASHHDSTGGKISANQDPYVVKKGVLHRLNRQLLEENSNRQDLIAVQNSFSQFEAHVIQSIQTALNSYNQFMSGQADRQKAMFGDMAATASNIPLDFEWAGFNQRSQGVLVNPNAPPRTMKDVTFPNENHRSTKPIIEGTLERKSRGMGALKGYSSGHYALTPAGFLHEYKDNDNFSRDPTPERSLYLPDCIIGAVDGTKFTIKGKDTSGGKLNQKMAITSDFQFKALTNGDAGSWHSIIASFANSGGSVPTSPVESRNVTPIMTRADEPQTQGVISAGPTPTSAHPTIASSSSPPLPGRGAVASPTGPTSTALGDKK